MRPLRSRHLVFWPVAVGGFLADLVSKEAAFAAIGDATSGRAGSVAVIPDVFHLTTSMNPGALWGLGARYGPVLTVLAALAAVGIVVWLCLYLNNEERWLTVALALIAAGAIGNVVDRLRFQAVRDFLDFVLINWPVFNLADTWLVIGAAMIVLQAFLFKRMPRTPPVPN